MARRELPNWLLPGWVFRLEKRRARIATVREGDGDACWRCHRPMVFDGRHPGQGRAATVEHLLPLSKGGTWALDNLVLCHVGCNRHLGDRTPEQKQRMRLPIPARE